MKRGGNALLTLARRLPFGSPPGGYVRLALIAFFTFVVIYYALERDQSFTIHAQTRAASIEVTGNRPHVWVLGDAILCKRRPSQIDVARGDGTCDARLFEVLESPEAEVLWSKDTTLDIYGMNPAQLAVQIGKIPGQSPTFDDIPITENSILFFDRTSLSDISSLVLSGHLALGELAETGGVHLVQQGLYEIRESLALTSGASVVATGSFLPGDYVRVEDKHQAPVPMRILITGPGSDLSDFDVIATSPPRPSSIVVQRIGAEQTRITPSWIDRLTNDALPLALSIFLGLFGASLGIAKSLTDDAKPRKKQHPET